MYRSSIREKLDRIRDRYSSIKSITAQLGLQPGHEVVQQALEQRAVLLADIQEQRRGLDALGDWSSTTDRESSLLIGQIHTLAHAIYDMDEQIGSSIAQRMEETRRELRTLYSGQRATTAYRAHSNMR